MRSTTVCVDVYLCEVDFLFVPFQQQADWHNINEALLEQV